MSFMSEMKLSNCGLFTVSIACALVLGSCGGGGGGGGSTATTAQPVPMNMMQDQDDNGGPNGDDNGSQQMPAVSDYVNLHTITATGRFIAAFRVLHAETGADENNILFLSANIEGFSGGLVDFNEVIFEMDRDTGMDMVMVGTTPFTVLDAFKDEEDGFGLLLHDANDELVVIVGSDPFVNLPMGEVRYAGTNFSSQTVEESGMPVRKDQTGTFTLTVNFANSTGMITAQSSLEEGNVTVTRTFNGPIMVNSMNGTFTGSNLDHNSTRGSETPTSLDPVTIGGIFNGDQATGVSGVYYTVGNGGKSDFSGYILGAMAEDEEMETSDEEMETSDEEMETSDEEMETSDDDMKTPDDTGNQNNMQDNAIRHDLAIIFDSPSAQNLFGIVRWTGTTSGMDEYTFHLLGTEDEGTVEKPAIAPKFKTPISGTDEFMPFPSDTIIDISAVNFGNNSGNITVGGTTYKVLSVKMEAGDSKAFAILVDEPDKNDQFILTGGVPVQNIPMGMHTYSGSSHLVHGLGDQSGQFTLAADFTNNSGSIDIDIEDGGMFKPALSIDGTLTIDSEKGTITGTLMQQMPLKISQGTGQFEGSFHGDGATGVAGVFVSHSFNSWVGYVVGTKQPPPTTP